MRVSTSPAAPLGGDPVRRLFEDGAEEAVGNYFVANYPPFSAWQKNDVAGFVERLGRPPRPDVPLGAYVHIPFCRKRCHFCYFRVYTDRNAGEIRAYLDALGDEARRFAATPFAARPLSFLYFGGGTPSYLSIAQLDHLVERLAAALDLDGLEEFAFECEPGTLTPGKLERIRRLGVTRLSLGVEHLDDGVLEANNRAHRSGEVYRAFAEARAAGFPQINLDLIAGMAGDGESTWRATVAETIRLAPDAVTIYQMESPRNTTFAKRMRDGSAAPALPGWRVKREWTSWAFGALRAAGYARSSAYTAVRDPAASRFVYRDALWHGADMLALGVSSFGHADGWHFQNDAAIGRYLEAIQAGGFATSRALRISPEEAMIRQFVLQLKTGAVQRSWFRDRFSCDILDRFGDGLALMEEHGLVRITDEGPRLTEPGYLRVDRVLPVFFLPEHRDIPYA